MKIVGINGLQSGSPATIMRGIASVAESEYGFEYSSYYGNWKNTDPAFKGSHRFGFFAENYLSGVSSRIFGMQCVGSYFGTRELINTIDHIKPDIVHLHNLHFWTINVPAVFEYLKKRKISVVWTLHDSWPFTGRCPYFQCTQCNKWKTGCYSCEYPRNSYPASLFDCSKRLWNKKKEWFSDIENMHIVTPSVWLSNLVKESFLAGYNVSVINNGIDLSIFKPTISDFRNKYNIGSDVCLLLGVALSWSYYKGLDIFIELSKKLSKEYKIVLVGIDPKIKRKLPSNIIAIEKTQSVAELVEIYSSSDIFINPTREENYPTVNMEAISCGTPVITFNTGGCAEIVDVSCGCVTDEMTSDAIISCIDVIRNSQEKYQRNCIKKSIVYDMHSKYVEYCDLYYKVLANCDTINNSIN